MSDQQETPSGADTPQQVSETGQLSRPEGLGPDATGEQLREAYGESQATGLGPDIGNDTLPPGVTTSEVQNEDFEVNPVTGSVNGQMQDYTRVTGSGSPPPPDDGIETIEGVNKDTVGTTVKVEGEVPVDAGVDRDRQPVDVPQPVVSEPPADDVYRRSQELNRQRYIDKQ